MSIVSTLPRKICPSCKSSVFWYDEFEDMYCCYECSQHLYPEELKEWLHEQVQQVVVE